MSTRFDPGDRDAFVRDLESSDEDVRRLALDRIEGVAPEDRPALLARALGDASWRVRKAAVGQLSVLGDSEAVARELIAALADGDNPGRRNSAVEALVECGSRMVLPLLEASSKPDSDVRKFVIDALAGIADPAAGPRVIELLTDADPNVRAAAADALGVFGNPGSGAALLGRAVDASEDATVRFSCLRALSAIDALVPARDLGPVLEDPILRSAGLALLNNGGDEDAVAALLAGLRAGSRSVRVAAMRSLVRIVVRSDEELSRRLGERLREAAAAEPAIAATAVTSLADADLATRLVMIQFLGLLREPGAVVPVLEAARDEALTCVALESLAAQGSLAEEPIAAAWSELASDVRRQACVLFSRTGGERGIDQLLAALEDGEPAVRIAAVRALAERGDPSTVARLCERLARVAAAADLEHEIDFETEEELAALGEALLALALAAPEGEPVRIELLEQLRSRLEGAGATARLYIAVLLGSVGQREDGRIMVRLLKDPSSRVRRAAVEALARLEPGSAGEPLRLALADEAATVRVAAVAALGASRSDQVMEDLLRLAEDSEAPVRAAAARTLGIRFAASSQDGRRRAALAVLDRALADEALVALAALEALTSLGGEAATRARVLLDRDEPELVKEAVRCLAAHGDEAALAALAPLVSHPDWSVRAETVEALAAQRAVEVAPAIREQLAAEKDDFVREVILRALQDLRV